MANESIPPKLRNSEVYIQANYAANNIIQKFIKLVKDKTRLISRLPPTWRENFNSFSVDRRNLLYMDQRLVIPKDMRENVLGAIHNRHVDFAGPFQNAYKQKMVLTRFRS